MPVRLGRRAAGNRSASDRRSGAVQACIATTGTADARNDGWFRPCLAGRAGQQVSVRGATTLAARLAALIGKPLQLDATERESFGSIPISLLPVAAEDLADASVALVAGIGLPRARASCVIALARAVADGKFPELCGSAPCVSASAFVRAFTALPGIGPWTAEYVTMRALQWPDAFPDADLGLRKAAGGLTSARLRRLADRWRPWRGYAAFHLWASLDAALDPLTKTIEISSPCSRQTKHSTPRS